MHKNWLHDPLSIPSGKTSSKIPETEDKIWLYVVSFACDSVINRDFPLEVTYLMGKLNGNQKIQCIKTDFMWTYLNVLQWYTNDPLSSCHIPSGKTSSKIPETEDKIWLYVVSFACDSVINRDFPLEVTYLMGKLHGNQKIQCIKTDFMWTYLSVI